MAPSELRMQEQILEEILAYQAKKKEQEKQDEELAREINFKQLIE